MIEMLETKLFGLTGLQSALQISLLGIFALSVISTDRAAAQSAAPRSFLSWCQQQEQLTPAARHTVNVMLEKAATEDCQQATEILESASSLSITEREISDLRPISTLNQLTVLRLVFNKISDIAPLASLTQLQVLQLEFNRIDGIGVLTNLTTLQELSLSHNQVEDVSPLASLTELRDLRLVDNRISDISSLGSLTKLEFLFLGKNDIEEIGPLAGLTQMRLLDLSNNPIDRETFRSLRPITEKNLRTIFIYGTPLPQDICPAELELTCFQ